MSYLYAHFMNGGHLRCSDEDREHVAEALREAAGEGRLTVSSLEIRLEATYNARTYADLASLTSDLPHGSYPVPQPPEPAWQQQKIKAPPAWRTQSTPVQKVPPHPIRPYLPARRSARITAVLRHVRRISPWKAPRRIAVMALFGDVTLDFCEATVPHPNVVVDVVAISGRVSLIVPDGVTVHAHEVRFVPARGRVHDARRQGDLHGGPVYRLQGLVLRGALTVRTP